MEQLKTKIFLIKKLAEELQKPFIRKFDKREADPFFTDDIWGTDPGRIQLRIKFKKGICFLLCVFDIFSKYAWVILLKDKKRYYNY